MSLPAHTEFPLPPPDKTRWPWTNMRPTTTDTVLDGTLWPRISVITPSYNQGKFIEETIRSVLLQNYPNLEYIIIDGGSSDDSLEIIEKYKPWLTYWVSQPDKGQSQAINHGFKYATGVIIAWLNSDDIYLPGALFHVANAYKLDKSAWITGITLVTDENLNALYYFLPNLNTGNWKAKDYKSLGWLDFVMTHQSGTALPQPSSFWSREAVSKAGGIDESYRYAMDHNLYGRLAHLGYKPNLILQTLACFRSHQNQKTRNFPIPFWEEELRSAREWQLQELTLEERQALNKYITWFFYKIKWERLTLATGLKRLDTSVLYIIVKIKKVLGKIKRLLIRDHAKGSVFQKGVVSKEILAKYIPENPVIIEAGAHIGLDTEELAKYYPGGKIYAFEPVPALYTQLITRMRPYKNVECFPYALSNRVGDFLLYLSSGASDGSSSLLPPKDHLIDHPDVIFDETIQVKCVTLDEWAEKNNIDKVDFLWLDMQGNELNSLEAGLTVLEKVRAIYTEVNLKEVYKGAALYIELREWLNTYNFTVKLEEIPWEDSGNVLFVKNEI